MNNLVINRTPELIAAEINSIKNQTKNIVLYNSIEIGRKLVEAKELINHGEWGGWLEESVDYSQRTAQNLMKIFEEYGSNQLTLLGNNAKTQALADLTYTQAVALLGIPEEEREAFIQENDISEMSTRELQQAIKERDSAKEALEHVRAILKNKSDEALKYYDAKSKAECDKKVANQVLEETKNTVKQLQEALQKEKDKSKQETERLQALIDNMKNQILEVQASGDNEEAENLQETLEKFETELNESKNKIKELEEQLNTPMESVIVEKVPEEVEKELAELRAKAQGGDIKVRFKVHFDILVKNFNDLLNDLEEMKENEDLHEKYRNATHSLIDRIVERL